MFIELNVPYIEKVYRSIKKAIIQDELEQGEVINERNLAESLHISRTPLRDALNLLEKEGWIIRQGKFRVVSYLHWEDIQDIYEVRVLNESFAVRKATENADLDDIREIEHILCQMETEYIQTRDYISFLEYDQRWHRAISGLCGNQRLCGILNVLYEQFVRISYITVKNGGPRLMDSMHEHREIFSAIASKNPELAAIASKRHITAWYHCLEEKWNKSKGF